jgi:phage FluMu protein Com
MKEILLDYRCTCGKLLMRGLILSGTVELKCRFCKEVTTIQGLSGGLTSDHRYSVFVNHRGEIVRASSTATGHHGHSLVALEKLHLSELIVMLDSVFFKTLWDALGSGGSTVAVFHTLQKNSDKSLTPVSVTAQFFNSTDDSYIVFTIEKKRSDNTFGIGGTVME